MRLGLRIERLLKRSLELMRNNNYFFLYLLTLELLCFLLIFLQHGTVYMACRPMECRYSEELCR